MVAAAICAARGFVVDSVYIKKQSVRTAQYGDFSADVWCFNSAGAVEKQKKRNGRDRGGMLLFSAADLCGEAAAVWNGGYTADFGVFDRVTFSGEDYCVGACDTLFASF